MQQVRADELETPSEITESMITSETGSVIEEEPQRNCLQRTFGPIRPGSMRGSIFTFLACSMGVGIFNLPFRIS